jgi:glycine betaine/proline transport system permease protein
MNFPEFPLGEGVESAVKWFTVNLADFFDTLSDGVRLVLSSIESLLLWLPWPVIILIFVLLAGKVAGRWVALFTGAALFFIGTLGLWEHAMTTLALVLTAVLISVALGIPLGILAARSDAVQAVVRPVLDGMQTIPSFVYLIPAIMFFGIGNVPGVLATVIFAMPPCVRLTNLGIRQVSPEVVEAANAFGSTSRQLLLKIQLPLAWPAIMAGVNQTIMMALSMVVVAAMIGAGGLGYDIVWSLQQIDIGRGAEAGLAILLIAMVIDRISMALGRPSRQRRSSA